MLRQQSMAQSSAIESVRSSGFIALNGLTRSNAGMFERIKKNEGQPIEAPNADQTSLRRLFEHYIVDLSKLSMHFEAEFRLGLTKKIKRMLSEDNWDKVDKLPEEAAFLTLLKCILLLETNRSPSIGSNGSGSISAIWVSGQNRITLECYGGDRLSFVLSRSTNDKEIERAAGHASVRRLLEVLRPYHPEVWFR